MQRDEKHRGNVRQVSVPLLRNELVSEKHHLLTFGFDSPLEALPGHFAMIRGIDWDNTPFLPRPMSLLEAGKHPAIMVKVVGEGTRRLAAAEPGDEFAFLAPLGRPWSPCSKDEIPLLVAGGVGICPLLFFARQCKKQGKSCLALYGGRTRGDLALQDELAKVSELQVATEDGSMGEKGRVTLLLEKAIEKAREQGHPTIYACGPAPMMASVVHTAQKLGVPCEVSLETVMACGYGVCLGCAVPKVGGGFLYACSDGACIEGSLVDWK